MRLDKSARLWGLFAARATRWLHWRLIEALWVRRSGRRTTEFEANWNGRLICFHQWWCRRLLHEADVKGCLSHPAVKGHAAALDKNRARFWHVFLFYQYVQG